MNILLDTHVLVWAQVDSPRLGKKARAALLKDSNTPRGFIDERISLTRLGLRFPWITPIASCGCRSAHLPNIFLTPQKAG